MENFSWVLPQKLAVGPFPRSPHGISYLARTGITAILCLTEEKEIKVDRDILNRFVWERVAMPDGARGGIPSLAHFETATAVLARWLDRGHAVYVHCWAGIGRSPSVCAAYLARSQGISAAAAIARVRERHGIACPDPHQIRVIRELLAEQP